MNIPKEKIDNYLQNKPRMEITEQKLILNAPITYNVILEAFKHQKKKKTPGPDGLPAEIYMKLDNTILNPFREVINEIRYKEVIPKTWQEATITVIHKQGTDPPKIKNYRPIS